MTYSMAPTHFPTDGAYFLCVFVDPLLTMLNTSFFSSTDRRMSGNNCLSLAQPLVLPSAMRFNLRFSEAKHKLQFQYERHTFTFFHSNLSVSTFLDIQFVCLQIASVTFLNIQTLPLVACHDITNMTANLLGCWKL